MDKTFLSCLLTFKLLIGKAHFEEVQSEHLHEEEQGIECRKNSSHVGEDVQKFEVPSTDLVCDR